MDLSKLNIKTHSDLRQLIKFLQDQGFGYFSDWDLHKKKLIQLISKNNKFHVGYDEDKIIREIDNIENYDEVDKKLNQYFSKFNVDDKILEYINTFYLSSDDSCRTPYSRPDVNDIILWAEFRKKFNLGNDFGTGNFVNFYNLDKNYLKIHFPEYKDYEFKHLYKLIFNEDCKNFDSSGKKTGEWQDIGKIEIKFFLKGGANIKGDLVKFKQFYYRYIKNKIYNSLVIRYNGKNEIIKKDED